MKEYKEEKELAMQLYMIAGELVRLLVTADDERTALIEQAKKTPAGT